MEQQQISAKKQKALDKVKRANAELAKVVCEENWFIELKEFYEKALMNRMA